MQGHRRSDQQHVFDLFRFSTPSGTFRYALTDEIVVCVAQVPHGSQGGRYYFGAGWWRGNYRSGMVLAVPVGAEAQFVNDGPGAGLVLSVPKKTAFQLAPELPGCATGDFGLAHAGPFAEPLIGAVLDRLWVATSESGGASRLLLEHGLILLLAALSTVHLGSVARSVPQGGLAPHVLRRVRERMLADLSEDIGLEELARLAGLSPFHFLRAFKQSAGLPPQAWRQRARLKASQSLLESTALPATDIALQVGYESSQALARAFRSRLGTSPSAYRHDHLETV